MLRRQHDAAEQIVANIAKLSRSEIDAAAAYQIGLALTKLTGVLRIHFAQEDRSLYPSLMASPDPRVSDIAKQFQREMGGLAPIYEAFADRWKLSSAILADVDGFRRESRSVFTALADRIRRENEELYPLAESPNASRAAA
jgi:hypothetical protein